LLGLRNGELPGSARFHTAVAAARETAFLACRHGVQIPTSGWKRRIGDICRATAANRCSMLEDLEAGRRTEIEALSGEVARRGERLCVGAPVNRTLATLVRSLERRTTGA
ncbi:MAG: ketopantoate reductase family protein, partial [Planctomycetota bacterium]